MILCTRQDMENPQIPRVVLDSNIIVSAIIFGGKPRIILQKVYDREIYGVISEAIINELNEALVKYFKIPSGKLRKINTRIKSRFEVVIPKFTIKISRDLADDKIVEAAVEGKCEYIITGDKDLLSLKNYKVVKIVTAAELLMNKRS